MKRQPYRAEIEESWMEPLLHVPPAKGDQVNVYNRLMLAQHEWEQALTEAREVLAANPLMKTMAEALARKSNKRGDATLLLDDTGKMFLDVQYKNTPLRPTEPKRKWESGLPSLHTLQEEAESLGIDTAPFGRSKTLLTAAIEAERSKAPKPKMMRTAPAVGPVTLINPAPKEETPEQPN